MEKTFSGGLGLGLTLLAVSGFMKRDTPKHLCGLMNVDTQHSLLRVPLTLALLYAGSQQSTLHSTRTILSGVGIFYLAIGIAGSADRSVGGVLPSKLTHFDLLYHFGVGTVALWLGSRSGRMMK
jgi:hypothetical protein